MKNLLAFIVLTLSLNAFSGETLEGYSKIGLQKLPHHSVFQINLGLIINGNMLTNTYGVFGLKRNNSKFSKAKYTNELLGVVELNSSSIGAIFSMTAEEDKKFTFSRIDRKSLDNICGNYYGGKIGLAIVAGGSGFVAMNRDRVVLRSVSPAIIAKVDVSVVKIKLRCLDENNANWNKTVILD